MSYKMKQKKILTLKNNSKNTILDTECSKCFVKIVKYLKPLKKLDELGLEKQNIKHQTLNKNDHISFPIVLLNSKRCFTYKSKK